MRIFEVLFVVAIFVFLILASFGIYEAEMNRKNFFTDCNGANDYTECIAVKEFGKAECINLNGETRYCNAE